VFNVVFYSVGIFDARIHPFSLIFANAMLNLEMTDPITFGRILVTNDYFLPW